MRLAVMFLLICACGMLSAQSPANLPRYSKEYMRYVLNTLASDEMKGREPGTSEEKLSAAFIEQQMKRMKLKPLRKKKFLQPFSYRSPDSVSTVYSAGNVIGKIETKSKYAIVISAHYDHIGSGKFHSLAPFSREIHNGADDNASGVALMLAMAAWASEHKDSLKYDLIFAAFSGEEDGLYGAQYFLQNVPVKKEYILCNLNFDMVGRLDTVRPQLRVDIENDSLWNNFLSKDTLPEFTVARRHNEFAGGADHQVFLDHKIPAVLISTGLSADYHKPTDDASRINFDGVMKITEYSRKLLLRIQNNPGTTKLMLREN